MSAAVVDLVAEMLRLSAADKLRLAAGLLDREQRDTAIVITKRALDELELQRLFRPAREASGG